MPNAQRTKLALKDMGEPSIIKTLPENIRQHRLGGLFGIATGFVSRTNPKDGTVMEGLAGAFRVVPSDEKRETLESGILFIPDAFHNGIAMRLREMQKTDTLATLDFTFDINVIRASNPIGYSWEFKPTREFAGKNPLDELQAAHEAFKALPPPPKVAQIAGKK